MNFLQQLFLQPAMLAGTLLVGVPILIYLFNRRRFHRRQWAAMEFLLRALRKNRRRLRLENLLLLLIRCAVLFLLACAMARPFLRSTALGPLSSGPNGWIIAVDTSFSMNYKQGTQTLFDSAIEGATRLVQEVVEPGDRVAVVTFDARPRVLVSPRSLTEVNRGEILEELAALRTGYRAVDVAASLQVSLEVANAFESNTGAGANLLPKRLIVFSDFQRRDWIAEDSLKDPAVSTLLGDLSDASVALRFADMETEGNNLSVVDLSVRPRVVSRDMWVEISTTIANRGRQPFEPAQLEFIVDGEKQTAQVLRVPAGGEVTRTLPFRFDTSGPHDIAVKVSGDDLTSDNWRYRAVDVLDEARVVLLDGDPGDSPVDRETFLLEIALLPEESDSFRRTPYQPVLERLDGLLEPRFDEAVAVVLANASPADLDRRLVEELTRYVERGGALWVFPGNQVLPQEYNTLFFREDGSGLLPVPMDSIVDRGDEPVHIEVADAEHPVGRYFEERSDLSYIGKRFISVSRFVRYELDRYDADTTASAEGEAGGGRDSAADADARVVFSLTDGARSPFVIESRHGQGAVLWFATTADLAWNDFSKYPDFVPFVHEYLPYLASLGGGELNLQLGEPIDEVIEAADFAPDVTVLVPSPAERSASVAPLARTINLQKIAETNRFRLLHEETQEPGVYRVRMRRPSAPAGEWTEREMRFAVNLDPAEGDLRRLTRDDLDRHLPQLEIEVFNATEKVREITENKSSAGGSEFWRPILWSILALLVLETFLAYRFGRRQV